MLKNVPVNKVDKASNRPKGNYIETLASAYLSREGYQILARNYAYMGGELDIVARDRETLVFVEVKSVWNNQQGNPAARVNALKQKKIWKTACHFIVTQKEHAPLGFDTPCRFDVLSARVYQKPLQFAHYKNAFDSNQVIPQV
ncbi:putative endonuclease [Fibrobacter sp. UWB15]|jgi:putative endonuclease|uniref:YraN family protein n=1 Tax=unclassified Fibrobacter TaxID=2634177 RepID=UPI0009245D45|nr:MULTISPECIES: YraN family protein [unclassified Fibrobacter]PWJ67787.1 putative endonuclease [Fibrobacter sp. UWB6]SHF78128.1 putative endonuclease [Fibrobacter sp. UWB8]SMG15133.1 putative endonuclease [Fibrobacter sp. UWB15]